MTRHVLTVATGKPHCHRSITAALQAARSGSVINVLPGVYEERLVIGVPVAIVAEQGRGSVTVVAADGSAALLAAEAATLSGLVLRSTGQQHPTVDAAAGLLTLEDCDVLADAVAAVATGNGGCVTMRNCRVENPGGLGVLLLDGADGLLDGCTVRNIGKSALVLGRGRHPGIQPRTITRGRRNGVS